MHPPLMQTNLLGLRLFSRGKVCDTYQLPDRRLLQARTDRISAFDHVLPTGIPDKGRVLAGMSEHWFRRIRSPRTCFITTDLTGLALPSELRDQLEGRSMVVEQCDVIPVECVVRGYLAGSGWKEYHQTRAVCGIDLPSGLQESARLPEPIFTPATKEQSGHDRNISFDQMVNHLILWLGDREKADDLSFKLYAASTSLYKFGAAEALKQGIIIADTKFEFGLTSTGEMLLIDEVLTPDSSRFWPVDQYQPGGPQPSFDKQFVRDWLEESGWDKESPPPLLPDEIVARTREKYIEAYERLTGQMFPWK